MNSDILSSQMSRIVTFSSSVGTALSQFLSCRSAQTQPNLTPSLNPNYLRGSRSTWAVARLRRMFRWRSPPKTPATRKASLDQPERGAARVYLQGGVAISVTALFAVLP